MENNSGLTSIRKKNKDVFGRSRRRWPVIIVGAFLVAALAVVSFVMTNNYQQKIDEVSESVKKYNQLSAALQRRQGQISEDKIDVGSLMNELPSSKTVSNESILAELINYVEAAGIDARTATFNVEGNSSIPETITGLSDTISAYECSMTVTASGANALETLTLLLDYIKNGSTYYYLYSYNVQISETVAQGNITLFTFVVNK